MTAPTQRLTDRAAVALGEEVVIAARVRKGPASGRGGGDVVGDMAAIPVLGVPVLPVFRSVARAVTDLFAGDEVVNGILAFTRSGDRVLLGRQRFRPLRPTGEILRIRDGEPAAVDMALLYEDLIPELELDGGHYIVNAVDFGVLTRAVVTGQLDEPVLVVQLRPYFEQVRAMISQDPRTVHSILHSGWEARRPADQS